MRILYACLCWALLVFSLGLVACDPDTPTVDLVISSSEPVPDGIDRVTLEVLAIGSGGEVCIAGEFLFTLESGDLPLHLWVERGDVYDEGFLYRVVAYLGTTPVLGPVVGWESWTAEELRSVRLVLEDGCFSSAGEELCEPTQTCTFDGCEEVEVPAELPDVSTVDEPCL